ncbi:recombinase family protein [Micromonospora sp. ATA32]|nr:recombinase family protein [Micromonospora sp. ATA32]
MRDKPVRAGIYARISDDREGHGLGVSRQEADCRKLAESRGWTVTATYVDNDVSATSRRKRPEYERMLDAIQAGDISAVICWDVDRLTRRPAELEVFIGLAERYGVHLASVGGEIDLATPQGRLTARIKGSVARHEAEQLQRRIKRKVEELAADGKIANGGPRPFGYRRIYVGEGNRRKIVRDDIEPAEAAIVRECADRALAGDSLRSIVGDLNTRGVPTSTGGVWTQQALRWMLRSGRIAGLREHKDVVVGKAVWPAIITEDQHKLLRTLLDAKERPPGSRVRLHYLTGFVYCSDCGERGIKMAVVPQHGKLKYRCPPKQEGGCNGRIIGLADLVGMVDAYMVGRLSDPQTLRDLAAREAAEDIRAAELLDRIEADERRLMLLTADMEDGDEDELPEVLVTVRKVRRRLRDAREEYARLSGSPEVARFDLPDLAVRWKELHIDTKRMLLRMFVDRITVGPARRGLAKFDPDRVDIVPRKATS